MADAFLHGWFYGGWNLEQSILCYHLIHYFDGKSSDRSGHADLGRRGRIFATFQVNTFVLLFNLQILKHFFKKTVCL